jgi:hypothetical protein
VTCSEAGTGIAVKIFCSFIPPFNTIISISERLLTGPMPVPQTQEWCAAGNMKTLHNYFSIPDFMAPDNAF